MQQAMTVMTTIAGLMFSVAVALLIEEFVFGKVFRVFLVAKSRRETELAAQAEDPR